MISSYTKNLQFFIKLLSKGDDSLCASSDCIDHRPEDVGWFDELLEYVGLCSQREPIVKHLL